MATRIMVTGSGTPVHAPGRAGPGVLVQHEGVTLQFDVGRGTTMRLADAEISLLDVTAVFLTHHHSDHTVGLTDLLLSSWLEDVGDSGRGNVVVYAPEGPATELASGLLVVWRDEIALRAEHTSRASSAGVDVRGFTAGEEPAPIATFGEVSVAAALVDHGPVVPSVGYRITTPDGIVTISGDTAPCDAMRRLATGADVLVHEAFRRRAIEPGFLSDPDAIARYHTNTDDAGKLAKEAGVDTLVLTHLIPPPADAEATAAFEADVRAVGFEGQVIVADDLASVTI